MSETIAIGDEVWTDDNEISKVISMDRSIGLYLLENGRVLSRHQFTLLKWDGDVVGVTGIGVCAKGADGQ